MAFMYIPLFVGCFIAFTFDFYDVIIILVIDVISFFIIQRIDIATFGRFFPRYKHIYPRLDYHAISKYGEEQKVELIKLLRKLPKIRSLYIIALSPIKVTAAAIFVVFFLENPSGEGYVFRWIKFWITVVPLAFTFFGSVVYMTLSQTVSQVLDRLNRQFDLSFAFTQIDVKEESMNIYKAESWTYIGAFIFSLSLIALAFTRWNNTTEALIAVNLVITTSVIVASRIYYLNRRMYNDELVGFIRRLSDFEKNEKKVFSLHSFPLIASLQQAYNKLAVEISERDIEIEHWMSSETEQRGYVNLGYMSGMIAHDLAGPLHTIKFCVGEIEEMVGSDHDLNEYLSQMNINVKQTMDLLESLKAQLRDGGSEQVASLYEAYNYTLQLVRTHFASQGGDRVAFSFDPVLHSYHVGMTRSNLIHVLYNIMRNAIADLLANNVEDAKVKLSKLEEHDGKITFAINDNGSGLDPEAFEKMTCNQSMMSAKLGLGLRLTRRLIEKHNGSLCICADSSINGTQLEITLPVGTNEIR